MCLILDGLHPVFYVYTVYMNFLLNILCILHQFLMVLVYPVELFNTLFFSLLSI